MGHLANTMYAVLLITVLAFTGAQSETETLTNSEVGRHYLDAMYSFNFAELEKSLHPDAVFEDPTSVAAVPDVVWRFNGRDAILDFIRQSSEGIDEADYQVLSEFSTGEFVVFNIDYSAVFDGEMMGMPDRRFSIKVPAVTILRIQDGLVIHHADHVNYDLMLEQIAEQSPEQPTQ